MRPATAFLKLALRRAARGTGSSPTFLERRTAMLATPDLHAILGSIPWVVIGGIALRAYAPERMTLDVDIMIAAADLVAAQVAFETAGYRLTGPLTIGGFTAHPTNEDGMSIDVLTSTAAWFAHAVAHPSFDLAGLPVMPKPYLLLLKLQAGRTQDLADVQRLLARTTTEERAQLRAVVNQYAADLVEDFDALVMLADLEYGTS